MTQAIIPAADPIPLPAPFWLLRLLLVVTFFLHIMAMNLLLGAGVLALAARLQSNGRELFERLFRDLTKIAPVFLAATITLGVAPLLFLQVLYGQFFYTATIVIGWPWFFVLIYLVVAYYGLYLVSFKQESLKSATSGWILLSSVLLLLLVGFMYTNSLTLMATPERWNTTYLTDPSGWNLNLTESTLVPRFLHFALAAVAVAGLFTAFLGVARRSVDEEYGRFLIQFGCRTFFFFTLLEFASGIWFLASLPSQQIARFMGENWIAAGSFGLGMLLGLAAMVVVAISGQQEHPLHGLVWGSVLTALTVLSMVVSRESLIDGSLAPHFDASSFAVQTQLDVLVLFLVLFVGGIFLWGVMMRRYFRRARSVTDMSVESNS